jgi:hypothetical protein
MAQDDRSTKQVDQFILDYIDTVPHLEALLLAWNSRPKAWSVSDMAKSLYVPHELADNILRDLSQKNLLSQTSDASGDLYQYEPGDQDHLVAQVDFAYRRELIRISRMIHAKAPAALRDFARAFRFTKEKD